MLARLVALQKQGGSVEPVVISLTDSGVVGPVITQTGVRLVTLNWRGLVGLPILIWRLTRTIRSANPDIVQTWMYHADLLGGLAAWAAGVRNILWGIRTTKLPSNAPWSTRFARWACARLSHLLPVAIACNAVAARDHHIKLGYDPRRIVVIPNGIDIEGLSPVGRDSTAMGERWGVPVGAFVVGMVGRDSPDKDPENFVAAMSRVFSVRRDVVAVMVGRGFTVENDRLGELIGSTGHRDRFFLVGESRDAASAMASFDVFVLPSRTEAFPNVLGEAMALGRPCVATNVGDVSKIIGNCGVMVPAENMQALADEVIALLKSSPSERVELGNRAREHIERNFAMSKASEAFERLYGDMRLAQSPIGRR
jgi:glycosyltransferase involved in cell wall biosynthesis